MYWKTFLLQKSHNQPLKWTSPLLFFSFVVFGPVYQHNKNLPFKNSCCSGFSANETTTSKVNERGQKEARDRRACFPEGGHTQRDPKVSDGICGRERDRLVESTPLHCGNKDNIRLVISSSQIAAVLMWQYEILLSKNMWGKWSGNSVHVSLVFCPHLVGSILADNVASARLSGHSSTQHWIIAQISAPGLRSTHNAQNLPLLTLEGQCSDSVSINVIWWKSQKEKRAFYSGFLAVW